jgi:hypothetical protein
MELKKKKKKKKERPNTHTELSYFVIHAASEVAQRQLNSRLLVVLSCVFLFEYFYMTCDNMSHWS